MKEITLYKFDPLDGQVSEDLAIFISEKLPAFPNFVDAAHVYQEQAGRLAMALYMHLPQATFDRLLVELMVYKVSVYRGKTES